MPCSCTLSGIPASCRQAEGDRSSVLAIAQLFHEPFFHERLNCFTQCRRRESHALCDLTKAQCRSLLKQAHKHFALGRRNTERHSTVPSLTTHRRCHSRKRSTNRNDFFQFDNSCEFVVNTQEYYIPPLGVYQDLLASQCNISLMYAHTTSGIDLASLVFAGASHLSSVFSGTLIRFANAERVISSRLMASRRNSC
ncbi:hypothetical protein PAQ31011_05148 [Pandoraea aquatica]|uniref:Uncharacterized protein n=1 Tax=Pandoraea aquatica TaxID=2508290 RepID=A0A5E4Z6S5_9BURK|nr:hypothetical protein PAQ31011_05148 [Pandoraea aquatica]